MSKYADLVTKLKAADKETIGLIAELLTILAEPDEDPNNTKKPVKDKPVVSEDMASKERAALILEGVGTAIYRDWETDRKSTRLNSSHSAKSRMPSSA